jgi:hypothetical protein
MLQQFGHYNKWIGFLDIDEFFLPSSNFQSLFLHHQESDMRSSDKNDIASSVSVESSSLSSSPIYRMLSELEGYSLLGRGAAPGVMFDTREMGCTPPPLSHVAIAPDPSHSMLTVDHTAFPYTSSSGGTSSSGTVSSGGTYECLRHDLAVTTHCTVAGRLFQEKKGGHGKMFVKPSHVYFMTTPHNLRSVIFLCFCFYYYQCFFI